MVGQTLRRQISELLQMSIQERQNLPESIARLAAQRLLYARAKRIRNLGFSLVLLVGLLAIIASLIQNPSFSYTVTLIALITWFIDNLFLKGRENALKKEAATIQEDFDCIVLDLPWPEHKGLQRPTADRIKQLATAAEKSPKITDKLTDWYTPDSIPDDPMQAKVYCQRMNCWWDVNLRQRFRTVLIVAFWGFIFLALLLSIVTGLTVAKLVALFASGLRIFAWGMSELNAQKAAIEQVNGLHQHFSKFTTENLPSTSGIRSVQDEIFEHRRSNSPVPDWFYWRERDSQEDDVAKP